MKISQEGIDFIKEVEGYSEFPYVCAGGKMTIGYGHVIKDNESFPTGVTKKTAEMLLRKDVEIAEKAVSQLVKTELLQNQFDALVSFVYNVGVQAFKESTLLKCLNANEFRNVPLQLKRWVYAKGKVNRGLTNRRLKEIQVFEKGF